MQNQQLNKGHVKIPWNWHFITWPFAIFLFAWNN